MFKNELPDNLINLLYSKKKEPLDKKKVSINITNVLKSYNEVF